MKKKARRYDEGGDINQRAKFFAALADNPEQQAAFQRKVHEEQQAEAEASDRKRAASAPTPKPSAAIVKAASRPVAEGKFTDSDESDRAERRDREEAENMARIEAARNLQTAEIKTPSMAQAAASAPRVGRAGQASSSSPLLRGGVHEQMNEARIAARRQAEDEANKRREEVAEARAAGAQRSANIAEGRRNQEAAESADARAAAAKAPGLGRAMMRKPSGSAETPAAPSRRFMAARVRKRVERPSGTEAFAKGGKVSSAASRGDGIAKRGKTRGRMV